MTNEVELADKPVEEKKEESPEGDEESGEEDKKEPQHELSWYLQSENSLEILNKRWVSFSFFTFFIYAFHLIMAIYAVNVFTDISRTRPCKDGADPDTFSTAIALSAIWHMIEWNRSALHFFSALVEVNMIGLYYMASINVPFGFIVCFLCIGTRYSGAGKACAEGVLQADGTTVIAQDQRAIYLSLHILFLILYIFTSFHHVLYFKIRGAEWCNEVYNEEEEEDDD